MFGRKKREDDDLTSKGFAKWANKFFRFVLFPFIHPVKFVVLLIVIAVVAFAVPFYYHVPFSEIPAWYHQIWNKYYQHTETAVKDNLFVPVKDKVSDLQHSVGYDVTVKAVEKQPNKNDMVAYASPQSVNRKLFEQAQEIPVDIKATLDFEKQEMSQAVARPVFKPIEGLGLSYLEQPTQQKGKVSVLNPNEVMINGTAMFLYGIYTVPSSSEGREATRYLKENIEGKEVECVIGAYTKDAMPTAICFYNGISINQRLIDLKFAKNVGLN